MENCEHGYSYNMCPFGCKQTTSPATAMPKQERNMEPELPLPPEYHEPIIRDNIIGEEGLSQLPQGENKLKCVICGQVVESGKVYKGKPICDDCGKGLKGSKEEEK